MTGDGERPIKSTRDGHSITTAQRHRTSTETFTSPRRHGRYVTAPNNRTSLSAENTSKQQARRELTTRGYGSVPPTRTKASNLTWCERLHEKTFCVCYCLLDDTLPGLTARW